MDSNRTILITGSDGLIGWHLRCFLLGKDRVQVIPCSRAQFADDSYLQAAISQADNIVHLAGLNRGDDDEIESVNISLGQRIVDFCRKLERRPHVLFASSTHIDGETQYGNSKRRVGELFTRWAKDEGAHFSNLILPHVFGEHGRPFYNSVVVTFAHQIAANETPEIHHDGDLELLHAQEVAQIFWEKIEKPEGGEFRPNGFPIKVSELLDRMQRLVARYRTDKVVPNFPNSLDVRLFNTFRSQLGEDGRSIDATVHSDDRGSLFEAIRSDGKGQVFFSTTRPGITRGNHFHFRKVERFLVVEGEATISLRRVFGSEIVTYRVSGTQPLAIDIPTLHTHNITNVGQQPLLTLFWTHEHFDSDDPDTLYLDVESKSELVTNIAVETSQKP